LEQSTLDCELKDSDNVIDSRLLPRRQLSGEKSDDSADLRRSVQGMSGSMDLYRAAKRVSLTAPEQILRDFVDFQTLEQVRVICRFRPSNKLEQREEKQKGLEQVYPTIDAQALTIPGQKSQDNNSSKKARTFYLDNIISWKCSQNRCFRVIGFPMVESVLAGYNATIFAYGQTGSGKTYTMFGPETNSYAPRQIGLIQRALSLLFKRLGQRKSGKKVAKEKVIDNYAVKIQFVQIYKERLFDLLNPTSGFKLRIRWDPRTDAPYIENITQNIVHDTKDVLKLTKIAISNRVTDKTEMNAVSSRSHLVMTIMVEQNQADGTKVSSKLNFGDLAGSESIRKTGVRVGTKQFQELRSINLSLTQLTTVINDIVHNRRPAFRASKLTHLLQDSLGGNTKTTIVVCASPHVFNRDETIRTLKFAQSAKTVRNKAKINKEYTTDQFKKIIQNLELENERLKVNVAKLEGKLKLADLSGTQKGAESDEYKKIITEVSELETSTASDTILRDIHELRDQLRLKGIDLDAATVHIQELQSEKHELEDRCTSFKDRASQLDKEIEGVRAQLDATLSSKKSLKHSVEILEEQLQEKCEDIQLQKEQGVNYGQTLQLKEEELTSKKLIIQELQDQIITLRKKLVVEERARLDVEKSEVGLRIHVRKLSVQLDEQNQSNRELEKKIREEIATHGNYVRESKKKIEKAEEIKMTAEELLQKHNLDEYVLSGMGADMAQVLHSWRNRHKKKKKKMIHNPNTTLLLQMRSIIAFFNIAMNQLEVYEREKKEKNVKHVQVQKKEQQTRKLKRAIEKLEEELLNLRVENRAAKVEIDRLKLEISSSFGFRASTVDTETDAEMLKYLDNVVSETIIEEDSEHHFGDEEDEKQEKHVDEEWCRGLKKGDKLDVLDTNDLWFTASVLAVLNDKNGDKLLIHYDGFEPKYDEWIFRLDPRLAMPGTRAVGGKETGGTELYDCHIQGTRDGKEFVKDGYLELRLQRQIFLSRYFVLFQAGTLCFYVRKGGDILGEIDLRQVREIEMDKADHTERLFEFSLREVERVWVIRVDSVEESREWVHALRTVRLKLVNGAFPGVFVKASDSLNLTHKSNSLTRGSVWNNPQQDNIKPVHTGYMWKIGENGCWERRYFALNETRTERTLMHFSSKTELDLFDGKPEGRIDISRALEMSQLNDRRNVTIKLPTDCVTGMRLETSASLWVLGLETMESYREWEKVITKNCMFNTIKEESIISSAPVAHSNDVPIVATIVTDTRPERSNSLTRGSVRVDESPALEEEDNILLSERGILV